MIALPGFMLRDLRGASKVRSLWVFGACLLLGIALIAACGSLLQLVRDGFEQQERKLFGGDIQISQRQAITNEQQAWLNANANVSLLLELRTMMGTEAGEFSVVELQSVDDAYPLYGEVLLAPDMTLQEAVEQSDEGVWGAAFDPALVQQLSLEVGQRVTIGDLEVELRAMILEQPDRSLRADFRGPPMIVDEGALRDSGLLLPTSLIDYDYRLRIDGDAIEWRDQLRDAFPDASWEVQTVEERGELVGRRLDQVASVLLLIGFSTLLIGGLGVANSVGAYLQTKLRTIATLQSLGSRAPQVASVYIGQITLLATIASTAGALVGSLVAWAAAQSLSERLPINPSLQALLPPTLLAIVLGICTALAFTLPTLGRTLNMPTALLIKGLVSDKTKAPDAYRWATGLVGLVGLLLLLVFVPEPMIASGFVVCIVALLLLLDGIVLMIRRAAEKLMHVRVLDGHFALRLAIAGLYRPGASLRPMLLSLGTALTLLVASALIIASTYRTLNDTVPERAPSMVLYDLQKPQVEDFNATVAALSGYQDHSIAPLVLGRLTRVNNENLTDSDVASRALEANDEHKLSYRLRNIDNTTVDRGQWWPDNYTGPPLVAMEDREADQLGLQVGDVLEFTILGEPVIATLSAIYSQARFETSFWLEAVFTDNILEPFITRYIGSVMLDPGADIAAQSALGASFPNVVTVRTAKILESSRAILSSAGLAMMLIAAVSLSASVLVMASVVAVNRQRQVYEASIMHAMGTRMSVVMKSVVFEYLLLAIVLSVFAMVIGGALAQALLTYWLKLDSAGSAWAGAVVATGASTFCLFAGALWLVSTLKVSPAILLRRAG
ncbi:MAG: ABC transporter permease [Granulosicoccus sp.]